MKKIMLLIIALVFVSGCVGDDMKGDVSIENDSIVFTPEPITLKMQDVIDIGVDFVKDVLDFSEKSETGENDLLAE